MKLLVTATIVAAAFASNSSVFQTTFVSSTDRNSFNDADKVEIKLLHNDSSGVISESAWDDLGQAFVRGVEKTEQIFVKDLSVLPNFLQIRSKDWNGLNFITIALNGDNTNVVQFKTDYFETSGAPAHSNNVYQYEEVFRSSAGATVDSPEGRTFKVAWRTGWTDSSSPMYIQFQGASGNSRFYLINDVFTAGHVNEVTIGVHENIGKLLKVKLMAGGPSTWNPVNFMEVKTNAGEVVQFETDVMLDQLPPYSDNDFGMINGHVSAYRHHYSFVLNAINEEGTALTNPREYQATFHTGTISDSNSQSNQFVQLIGNTGRTNFMKLGDDFQKGQRTVVDLAVMHDIGELQQIALKAGGTDSWLVVGDFSVKTPNDVLVHFQTDLFLDEKPHDGASQYHGYEYTNKKTLTTEHPQPPNPCSTRGEHNCCGNGICDATEDVGNCAIDCKNSGWASYAWGNQEEPAQVNTTIVHPPIAWETASHYGNTANNTNLFEGDHTPASTAAPVLATTTTKAPKMSCTVSGRSPLPDGWTMAGTGSNYCNYCKCANGILTCTHKICGDPFGGTTPSGWSKCPANTISCTANEEGRVSVTSNVQGGTYRGGKHKCAYNPMGVHMGGSPHGSVSNGTCTCYCKMAKIDHQKQEVGKIDFGDSGFDGRSCKKVHFAKGGFDPVLGDVTVIVTASHSQSSVVHDAPALWVEMATPTHFVACAREDKKNWRSNDYHEHRLVIEYYAFQNNRKTENNTLVPDANKPFPGAQGGSEPISDRQDGGVYCKTVPFRKAFDREPILLGTVDYDTTEFTAGSDAITHWLELVNEQKFRVCFRETLAKANTANSNVTGDDGFLQSFNFNWMAVEDRNAEIGAVANKYDYSAAGMASSEGMWTKGKNLNGAEAGQDSNGQNIMHACKWLSYGKTFSTRPTVLVESKHNVAVNGGGVLDWANQPTHEATISYVNVVHKDRFQVCAATLHAENAAQDDALQWNWIAFGPEFQSETLHSYEGTR